MDNDDSDDLMFFQIIIIGTLLSMIFIVAVGRFG